MKCFQLALPTLVLMVESTVARPLFGLPSKLRMPAFAKRAFLSDEIATTTTTVLPLRGGASAEHLTVHEEEDEAHMPPRISASDMALALRWTGEINRRLEWSSRLSTDDSASASRLVAASPPSHHQYSTDMRGGGGEGGEATSTTNVDPSAPVLTLFHAKSPRPTGNGANRWGPSLEAYITHICHALQISPEAAPELSLALMYLDRATSAETPRSQGNVPAVPFLQPRTAHRLVLAALLLATHTTQGWPLPVLMERVESLGIPAEQLSHMLQWMHGALGDPGYFVTLYSIQNWRHVLAETARLRDLLPPQGGQGRKETLAMSETVPAATPSSERRQDTIERTETREPTSREGDEAAATARATATTTSASLPADDHSPLVEAA